MRWTPRPTPTLLIALTVVLVLAGRRAAGDEPVFRVHSDRGCNQCHVPHRGTGDNSQVPLWNPQNTSTSLTGHYTSGTLDATPGAPDGASRLCLSCHDGTYAMSDTFKFGTGPGSHMGTLEASHPISFVFDTTLAETDGALVDPATLEVDVLDGQGKMQCTSCHDVHQQAVDRDKMLRWSSYNPGAGSPASIGFCRHCHLK